MRKKVYGRQFGRDKNQRTALFKGLVSSLVEKGKIKTTLPKVKAVIGTAEKLITKAKRGSLSGRRLIFRFLNKRSLVDRLVDGIAPLLKERKSGYLRIIKLGIRKGDRAEMAQLSFVDEISIVEKPIKPEIVKEVKKKNDKNN